MFSLISLPGAVAADDDVLFHGCVSPECSRKFSGEGEMAIGMFKWLLGCSSHRRLSCSSPTRSLRLGEELSETSRRNANNPDCPSHEHAEIQAHGILCKAV